MTIDPAPVTPADVRAAATRLDGVAHRTPVVRSRTLDDLARRAVFFKCENLQRAGAFKFRGAYNAASRLSVDQLGAGIVTYSSGNHGQAVALAARELGTQAVVIMPEDVPASKAEAVAGYGAEIVTYDRYSGDRAAIARQLAEGRGMALVPPYDDPHVIAGQGTAALELLEEVGDLDALVVPVGGGGLIAGCATIVAALRPGLRVVGVEPEAGDDTKRSLAAGDRVRIPVPRTIADGQAVDVPGELTFPIVRRLVSGVVLVSDAEILAAMRVAFDRLKLVVEPSGASGIAAALSGRIDEVAPGAERVGVVVSGGNVDTARFVELMKAAR
ncbi:MAG TPA: pyridoxal-phosphate dependent enzyme [Acidimicrobiales bacterium]|nr:pyridoxal-phosphate dependent enzyme [Acidimicrobiales bacterium]